MYRTKKSDMFVMWAEALEEKINNGTLELEITGISKHINHELKSLNLETAIYHMYDTLPAKYKKQSIHNEDEFEQSLLGNPNENSSDDVISEILHLDISHALEVLRRAFPVSEPPADAKSFGTSALANVADVSNTESVSNDPG